MREVPANQLLDEQDRAKADWQWALLMVHRAMDDVSRFDSKAYINIRNLRQMKDVAHLKLDLELANLAIKTDSYAQKRRLVTLLVSAGLAKE